MTDSSNEDMKPEPEDRFGTVERVTSNFEFAAPVKAKASDSSKKADAERRSAKITLLGLMVPIIAYGIFTFGVLCLGLFGVYVLIKTIFS